MVLASHVILGMYGFWLPNDERGSWSEFVGSWELLRFGQATTVRVRESLARRPFDPAKRAAAQAALKCPPVVLSGVQARAVARGFAHYAEQANLDILACAILPQHVHLVLARHRLNVEQLVNLLKGAATRELNDEQLHPLAAFQGAMRRPPKAFARGEWKVFLDTPFDIRRAIRYVERNPLRENLPAQRWSFVRPFDSKCFVCNEYPHDALPYGSRLNKLADRNPTVWPRPAGERAILFEVWRKNPGVIDQPAAAASLDPKLRSFATTLTEHFQIVDLRTASPGMGFSWGRYGPRTELRRHGYKRIFAYAKPPRRGLLATLLGR